MACGFNARKPFACDFVLFINQTKSTKPDKSNKKSLLDLFLFVDFV